MYAFHALLMFAGHEVLVAARASQVAVESLSQVDPNARASQVAVESLSRVDPTARFTQMAVEVLSSVAETETFKPFIFVIT